MTASIEVQLAFGPGGTAWGTGVLLLLGKIYAHIRYDVIPPFAPFFGVRPSDPRLHGHHLGPASWR